MRYSISKISQIVGISSEAVRLYEKKGVLRSRKNPVNGYRTFHTLDIGTLLRCRTYAQLGLSLNEAADLINTKSVEEAYECLSRQEERLARQIEMSQRSRKRLQDLNRQIRCCERDAGTLRMEKHPGLYHLDYRHNELILEGAQRIEQYANWSQLVPLSFVSLRFPLQSLLRGEQNYYGGLGVMEEDAHFLGIEEGKYVRCFPARKSVRTILKIPGEKPIAPEALRPALDYIQSSGYKPSGDPFTRMVVTVKRNQPDFVRYYEMWIPITELN